MLENAPNRLPRIAISVGECTGIGPELALKCAACPQVVDRCVPLVYGPAAVVGRIAGILSLPCPEVGGSSSDKPAIVDVGEVKQNQVHPGEFDATTGAASFSAVILAVQAALGGEVDAVVTGPIQKEAWHLAGIHYPGHTELLAEKTATADYCMMLTSETISCVLATVHIAYADVPNQLSSENVLRAIRLGADALTRRHGRPARVGVCALNPHAGENGLFSHGEETEFIEPAIDAARQLEIDVTGPLSPDTAFTAAMRERFDVYVCMYHDQGLIPLKALSFDEAVNVTLGLPIVRTSVDHGTAMDIAWQGKANHHSMLAAIRMAIDLC